MRRTVTIRKGSYHLTVRSNRRDPSATLYPRWPALHDLADQSELGSYPPQSKIAAGALPVIIGNRGGIIDLILESTRPIFQFSVLSRRRMADMAQDAGNRKKHKCPRADGCHPECSESGQFASGASRNFLPPRNAPPLQWRGWGSGKNYSRSSRTAAIILARQMPGKAVGLRRAAT